MFTRLQAHGAHGCLLRQFLSPMANKLTYEFGDRPEQGMRFPSKAVGGVRHYSPDGKPLFLGNSAVNETGCTTQDSSAVARVLRSHCMDIIDCVSSGMFDASTNDGLTCPDAEQSLGSWLGKRAAHREDIKP
jgi:2,4-dienoyl-CoA reductase-like NADH-dependent reductase (Old Yellow Enzyme family)